MPYCAVTNSCLGTAVVTAAAIVSVGDSLFSEAYLVYTLYHR